jgi:hypothetical protein
VDHVAVLDMAIAALPPRARPQPGNPDGPRPSASADSAGATHVFADALRERGIAFSLGERAAGDPGPSRGRVDAGLQRRRHQQCAGARIVVAGLCMQTFEPTFGLLKEVDVRFALMWSVQAFAGLASPERHAKVLIDPSLG